MPLIPVGLETFSNGGSHSSTCYIDFMAVWQWDVWLVPENEVSHRFPIPPAFLEMEWFESVNWWRDLEESKLIRSFDKLLPVFPMPWAENTYGWGSEDGDRITLVIENDIVADISVRITLAQLNLDFVSHLVSFAKAEQMLFYPVESNRFIQPDLSLLLSEMRSSRKWTFVRDPERFFKDKRYLNSIQKRNLKKIDD